MTYGELKKLRFVMPYAKSLGPNGESDLVMQPSDQSVVPAPATDGSSELVCYHSRSSRTFDEQYMPPSVELVLAHLLYQTALSDEYLRGAPQLFMASNKLVLSISHRRHVPVDIEHLSTLDDLIAKVWAMWRLGVLGE